MPDARVFTFDLETADHPADDWRVLGFEWDEALDGGSRGVVHARTRTPDRIAPESLLGTKATLTVRTGGDRAARTFHGVVLEATDAVRPDGTWALDLMVGARVELLRIGQNRRQFLDASVPEVARAVLEEAGLDGQAQAWKTRGTYPKRPRITQGGESDWDFVVRLLASEGIGFTVRSADGDADVVTFFDDAGGQTPVAEENQVEEGATSAGDAGAARVREVRGRAVATPDAVMLRDYDFKRPSLDLSAKEAAPKSAGREVYLHPAGASETSEVKRLAKQELQRLRATAETVSGRSDHCHLEPGRTFHLAGHARGALALDLHVIAVRHVGRREAEDVDAAYANAFEAVAKDVPWRPERREAPPARGLQPAFVTGPAGAELHSNAFGQAKVRFPWDPARPTDDRSSPWLRVGQLALGGGLLMPRVGFEVLVDHELGDHDRPVVVGHVYNGQDNPPYELPGGATRSSFQTATTGGGAGANELRFEDSAGAEELFLAASRDYTFSAEHDAAVTVTKDAKQKVGGNVGFSVGANLNEQTVGARSTSVGRNDKLAVTGDLGEGVKGAVQLTVGAVRKQTVGGDLSETVGGDLDRSVGALQSITGIGGVQRTVLGDAKTTVGAAWMEAVGMSRASTVGGRRTETVGGLKLVKAKTMSVDCGKAHVTNCAALSTKVGGDKSDSAGKALAITAGGGISIQAENINIVAESRLLFRIGGSSLELTPSGVTLKSTSIDLKGVKKIGSTQHSSG